MCEPLLVEPEGSGLEILVGHFLLLDNHVVAAAHVLVLGRGEHEVKLSGTVGHEFGKLAHCHSVGHISAHGIRGGDVLIGGVLDCHQHALVGRGRHSLGAESQQVVRRQLDIAVEVAVKSHCFHRVGRDLE